MGSCSKQIPLLRFIASCVLASSCSYTMVHSSTSQPWPAAAGPGHSEELTMTVVRLLMTTFFWLDFTVNISMFAWRGWGGMFLPQTQHGLSSSSSSSSLSVSARRIEEPSACLCSCTWWPGLTMRSLFLLPLCTWLLCLFSLVFCWVLNEPLAWIRSWTWSWSGLTMRSLFLLALTWLLCLLFLIFCWVLDEPLVWIRSWTWSWSDLTMRSLFPLLDCFAFSPPPPLSALGRSCLLLCIRLMVCRNRLLPFSFQMDAAL